ncbi:MAG: hypothetical protein K2N86_02205 [Rikenellaceae bacterium]|nr:hypothetical protein [Rikenellaceae bacterium]MDE7355601.1 hypothetical protein [Rikenellaceae bacterium]
MESKRPDETTFWDILDKVIAHKKRVTVITGVVVILGVVYALSVPRMYTAKAELVMEKKSSQSGLSGAMNMLGLSSMGGGEDGITIELAPTIIKSIPFMLEFENAQISLVNPPAGAPGKLSFSEYLSDYQRKPWWSPKGSKKKESGGKNSNTKYDITDSQRSFLLAARSTFEVVSDKKSTVMTLSATTQDPLASVILVDSLTSKLQQYLINYQTGKAKQELDMALVIAEAARERYYKCQEEYSKVVDKNLNPNKKSVQAYLERLMSDVDIASQTYRAAASQVDVARAKVSENTPSFTILTPPLFDESPSEPKRKLICVVALILGLFFGVGSVVVGDIWRAIMQSKNTKK